MNITKNFVKMKQPCVSGMRWFLRHQEQGSDYQPLLDALVELHRFMLSYIAAMNFRFGSKAVVDGAQKAAKTMLRHFGQACIVLPWRAAHVAF